MKDIVSKKNIGVCLSSISQSSEGIFSTNLVTCSLISSPPSSRLCVSDQKSGDNLNTIQGLFEQLRIDPKEERNRIINTKKSKIQMFQHLTININKRYTAKKIHL
ncbi:hypothetical protein ACTFIR_003814 [Dictyostelium discoideum]